MKYKRFIKPAALISAVAIIFMVSGCGKHATSSGGIVVNNGNTAQGFSDSGSAQNTSNPGVDAKDFGEDVAAVVGGEEIKLSDIGYYIYNNAVITVNKAVVGNLDSSDNSASSSTADDILRFDWNDLSANGRTYRENVVHNALDDAINDVAFRQMAEKCGYSVDSSKNEATRLIDDAIETNGEEKILANAALLGISDIETYKKIYTNIAVFEGVAKEFSENSKKYIDDTEILSDYVGTKGVTVQSILIMNDTDKGKADAVAREAAGKAQSGQDFARLMKEYNEDTGESESGYTFPEGEMQSDFENAAFSLGIGEVSDVIRSDYGYYIIKRVAGAYELQNYWRSISEVSIAPNVYDLIDFDEVISMISSANPD